LLAFLALFLGLLVVLLFKLRQYLNGMMEKTEEEIQFENQDIWSRIFQLRPMGMERKLLMDHSYDGIQELDNPTPPWFMFLFYSTIAFAVVYGIIYHGMGTGQIMENEYTAQVKEAEVIRAAYLKKFANSINENNVTMVSDKAKIQEGKSIYDNNCVACHGAAGEGKVGPNLTDNYHIHGSGIKNVFRTITEGVPEKGMIAWKKQLNPLQIQLVSSYILTLKGTNPPNPKEPQGTPEGEPQATSQN
jgi:cytochrome c oxidase cbb3-type subunit 3